jgi:hypothetical protein
MVKRSRYWKKAAMVYNEVEQLLRTHLEKPKKITKYYLKREVMMLGFEQGDYE